MLLLLLLLLLLLVRGLLVLLVLLVQLGDVLHMWLVVHLGRRDVLLLPTATATATACILVVHSLL